jgi:hypothetical protein
MGGIFSSPKIPDPTPAPAPPSRSDAEVREAALAARQRAAGASGRASTIKTSGKGVTDEDTPALKKLLGE